MHTAESTRAHQSRHVLAPAYFHPRRHPQAWEQLTTDGSLHCAVINPDNGPGKNPDAAYEAARWRLHRNGSQALGYVDTDYGRRPHWAVVADIERFRCWYAVDGIFFDQVASSDALLPYYRRLTVAARSFGATTLVLNPGTHPTPTYADLADVLVTFEGAWSTYQEANVPSWTRTHPPERFCHLVYDVPKSFAVHVREIARFRHASLSYATPGALPNPWDDFVQIRPGDNEQANQQPWQDGS